MHKWCVYSEFDEASKAAADFLASNIDASIERNNACHVILPGGNTPKKCLNYLAEMNLPWDKISWYLGDERCFPTGHPDRNDVMLEKNLWSHIAAPNIFRMPAEFGAELGARMYGEIIKHIDRFDIAFLGMGEDGHTASLFPDNEALRDVRPVVPVYHSPKAPDERVSLGVNTLKSARCRMVLTGGSAKADIIARINKGETLPVNNVGDINWYVDQAAMTASQ